MVAAICLWVTGSMLKRSPRAVERRLLRGELAVRDRLQAGEDGEATALRVPDGRRHVPRADGEHLPLERRLPVEPLEDGGVRVRLLLVAVDARVREAHRHLAVAGAGEVVRARHPGRAVLRPVALDLSLRGDCVPQERHQRPAT